MLKNSTDFEVSFLLNIFEQDTNIFVYKPFLPLNISNFSLVFFVKIATHLKEVTPSFPATPSQSWGPVKRHLFENLVGGSTPQQKGGGEWGVRTMYQILTGDVVIFFFPLNILSYKEFL